MFSSERMNKFGLGITFTTEYAKGGGGGSSPPPRDYSPEWTKVKAGSDEAYKQLKKVSDDVNVISLGSNWREKQDIINAEIQAATTKIDETLALDATIPASWFGSRAGDHTAVVNQLKQTRDNLQRYIGDRKPSAFDLISDEVDRQVLLLAQQGRIIGKPIDPVPARDVYPIGCWQYRIWERGYTLYEISWLEEKIARDRLQERVGGDTNLFLKYAEDELQDAITSGTIPPRSQQEILTNAAQTATVTNTVATTGTGQWLPTGEVLGTGTWDGKTAPPLGAVLGVTYFGSDGVQYPNTWSIPVGVRYSLSPWVYVDSGTSEYKKPELPAYIIDGSYEARLYMRRDMRNVGRRRYIPGQPVYDVGSGKALRDPGFGFRDDMWRPPTLGIIRDQFGNIVSTTKSVPWCGTNPGNNKGWEAQLIGQGCSPDHLEVVRLTFAKTRFKPGADKAAIAKSICDKLDAGGVSDGTGVYLGNQIDVLDGVFKCSLPATSINNQATRARRQIQRARRGAFR